MMILSCQIIQVFRFREGYTHANAPLRKRTGQHRHHCLIRCRESSPSVRPSRGTGPLSPQPRFLFESRTSVQIHRGPRLFDVRVPIPPTYDNYRQKSLDLWRKSIYTVFVRSEDRVAEAAGGWHPLVEDRIQAEMMHHVRAMSRPVSRSEMTDALGVSRSKISMEVGRLIEAGLLAEDGLAKSEDGRRSSLLRIPRSAGLIAAVDLGATSTDVALSTLGGEILVHRGEPGDVKDGPDKVLGRVKELLSELLVEEGADAREVLAVGVGVPGPVEHASGVLRSPPIMPGWDGFPIRGAFAGEYDAPVF